MNIYLVSFFLTLLIGTGFILGSSFPLLGSTIAGLGIVAMIFMILNLNE